MAIAARLRKLRAKKGLSLQQLADKVESTKSYIWELESGKRTNPTVDLLARLANELGTTVAWLVGEDAKSADEDQALGLMFRNLEELQVTDREIVKDLIVSLKKRAKDR
ncbi:MAG: helix-turn-helix domain-containing protein [Burkholderiales bacterium]|jgi:transcriptional regulator with XRE-family HTH domain|nr:helix-turn-helix domain-containing protein [Burkholderiales bacterium]